jgi:cobalamin biosynthesis Mg chelatase CobN
MTTVNYKSDFDFYLSLVDSRGVDIGVPTCDFTIVFTTTGLSCYVASRVDDVFTNCFDDEGRLHIVMDNHRLSAGTLKAKVTLDPENKIYPDVKQATVYPFGLEIQLVTGLGDTPMAAEIEKTLPFIKGDKGDKGDDLLYSSLTDEDKQNLTDNLYAKFEPTLNAALKDFDDLENEVKQAEEERASAENSRVEAETKRVSAENERVEAETARQNAEKERETATETAVSNANSAASAANSAATEATTIANEAKEQADAAKNYVDQIGGSLDEIEALLDKLNA